MNSTDRPACLSAKPMDDVARRLSLLGVFGGAIAGSLTAGLRESSGSTGPVAVGGGLVAFVAGTSFATFLATGRPVSHHGRRPL